MGNLVLILGDQLSETISSLKGFNASRDRVVMAEVLQEATYTQHHKKKIALIFSAMRHFAQQLADQGIDIDYHRFNPASGIQTLTDAVVHALESSQAERLIVTECGEWRLDRIIRDWQSQLPVPVEIRADTRFICSKEQFATWAEGRRQLRMEFFYRAMRRTTGLLMTAGGQPEGGQWNFDPDNRRKWAGKPPAPVPFRVEPDSITREVMALVEQQFPTHFGVLDDFHFAVNRDQALEALAYFIDFALPCFGDYQDAMASGEDWLFHSILSPYINLGLLDPLEVCQAAELAWQEGRAPINAVEGFIRQIIGWREYVRGIYWLKMPGYAKANALDAKRDLPWFYWTGQTGMRCLAQCIDATRRNGYAHHIQRLMVTGNFALLIGAEPAQVCDWYLAVYVDAYDWVELPNTLGMILHGDGGFLGSKPYAASGKYIQRMSDYCGRCPYSVSQTTGDKACPFNSLYWHFLERHRERFARNPRMAMMYRNWDRTDPERKATILARAEEVLANLEHL